MAQDATKGFVFFYDYRKHLSILSDEERGRLLIALLDYGETGKEPELDGAALMAFSFISSQIDRDAEKYAEICRRRREAGKKGGRPKAEGSEEETKKADAIEKEGEKPKDTEENREKAKKANGFEENQDKAKKANTNTKTKTKNKTRTNTKTKTKTNTKTNTFSSKEEESNASSSSDEKKKAPKGADAEEDATPYKDIVNLYHEICQSYPELKSVSSKRKKAMAACWKEYEGDLEAFRELFTKAEESTFMKGESESGWTADFNWMMDSDNMAKVLEGTYDEKVPKGKFGADAFFDAVAAKRMADKAENPPATAGTCAAIRDKAERLRALLN